jgi:2-phosphoxylose phosphatase
MSTCKTLPPTTRGLLTLFSLQARGVDSLEPQYSCPAGSSIAGQISSRNNPAWAQHLDAAQGLYATLDSISGVPSNDGGFHASFDHYYDNLSARQCHSKPLPCQLVNGVNSTTCVTQSLAHAVYRLGHWEYSQMYRDHPNSLAATSGTFGVWVAELAQHLRDVVNGKSGRPIYLHNVAHDGSVSRLLSILQIDEMVWPGMGAEVVFELWRKKSAASKGTGTCRSDDYFVRVLFGGQVMKSSSPTLGTMDMVPIAKLLGYFDGLVGKKASLMRSKCGV